MLAHAAYCESGGTASISVALWSPDGTPPKDLGDWEGAVAAAPTASDVAQAVHNALAPDGETMLLSRLPKAHTTGELTSLLEGSADPLAAEFITTRSDKDKGKQKELKAQMGAGGKFKPLLDSLAQQVDSTPPFAYPGFPSTQGDGAALMSYLRSIEFLHFPLTSHHGNAPSPSPSRATMCAGDSGCTMM